MSDVDVLDSRSFNKNDEVLKETADWLSGQKEPDIDQLVPKVETAMWAYAICKDQLDKVQATLGRYFQQGGDGATEDGDGRARKPTTPAPHGDGEEDETAS